MATSRTPTTSLQTILGTVGGLLIGHNAVNSGFISSFNLVIAALCYVSTYAITNNQRLITAFSLLRILLLISSFIFGLFGFLIVSILIISKLTTSKSLSIDYFSPISPIINKDIQRNLFSNHKFKLKLRDISLKQIDITKGKE